MTLLDYVSVLPIFIRGEKFKHTLIGSIPLSPDKRGDGGVKRLMKSEYIYMVFYNGSALLRGVILEVMSNKKN
jgi:hypothetical protein